MDNDRTAIQSATAALSPWTQSTTLPEPGRIDVALAVSDLQPAVAALMAARWGYLAAITGLDHGAAAGQIELLYHFCAGATVLTLRVRTPRDAPAVDSICASIPSASSFERELSEMFGITIDGTPDPTRLFLPEDWPAGDFPLRKDFELRA